MHTNTITGKSYIGLTKNSLQKRLRQHFQDAYRVRKGKLNYAKFPNAIRKYGTATWESTLIESGLSYDEAQAKEVYYIQKFNTYKNGYNSTVGGDSVFPEHVIKAVKEASHSSDKNIYNFINVDTKEAFSGTKFALIDKYFAKEGEYRNSRVGLSKVISGAQSTFKGWALVSVGSELINNKESKQRLNFLDKFWGNINKATETTPNKRLDIIKLNKITMRKNRPKLIRPKRGSQEWLENCRRNSTGSKNAMFGTSRPQYVKDAVSNRRRNEADKTLRTWYHKSGIIEYNIQTILLRDKYPELLISHLKRVSDGKENQHKGWKLSPWI